MKTLALLALLTFTPLAHADENEIHLDPSKLVSVSSQQTKKTDQLLVYFWATWCPDCQEKLKTELPKMQNGDHQGLALATINVDQDSSRAEHYVTKENLAVPVYRDNDKTLRKTFAAYSVPHWALLQRVPGSADAWTVLANHDGSDMAEMEKLLAEKSPAKKAQ